MSLRQRFFSFRGRISRKSWWLRLLAILVVYIAVIALVGSLAFTIVTSLGRDGAFPGLMTIALLLLLFPLMIAVFVSTLSIYARRIHDRGRSAWWLVVYFLGPGGLIALTEYTVSVNGVSQTVRPLGDGPASNVAAFLGVALLLWVIVDLGFLRGTRGPNRFGEDPLEPGLDQAEVFA